LATLSNELVATVGWRITYGICGAYGLIAVFFIIMFVREPQRGRFDPNLINITKQLSEVAETEREEHD
jgi:predicted MFS family arabinose efflux permease